jgi:hypothetical protein
MKPSVYSIYILTCRFLKDRLLLGCAMVQAKWLWSWYISALHNSSLLICRCSLTWVIAMDRQHIITFTSFKCGASSLIQHTKEVSFIQYVPEDQRS